jgi:uracil-DNA glycosylase
MDKAKEMRKLNSTYSRLPAGQKGWSLSRNYVPGDGPLDAKVMFIGQAPGRNEDIQRRPFIGTAGKFLDKLINIAGLERQDVYISSIVQFFPPANRIPTDEEVELCKQFILRQIEIVDPKVIVLLGSLACMTILGIDKVSKNHGKVLKKNGRTYLISIHPAAAVRIRTKMPIMESDFRKFRRIIRGH